MLRPLASTCMFAASLLVTWSVAKGCTRPFYGSSCSEMCGAKLTNSSGSIRSPGYESLSGQYVNSESCSWYIVPGNENSSMLITFKSLHTEACCDYLSIFAEPPTYSTLVARYRGHTLPFQVLLKGPIKLSFHSDGSVVGKGFEISYDLLEGTAPKVASLTNDMTARSGDNVLLPCHVTGIPQPDVTWYKDGLEVDFVLHSKFTIEGNDLLLKEVREEDAGVFKCRAENYINSTEQVFQLTVQVPPVIVSHPTDVHVDNIFDYTYRRRSHDEMQVVFRCAIHGVPKPTVYWKKDGRFLLNPMTVSAMDWLVIKPVSMSDTGNYTCFGNNIVGSAESRDASLTIGNELPCCLLLWFGSNTYMQVALGSGVKISVFFKYGTYTLSQITMTKDGYNYLPLEYQEKSIKSGDSQYYRVDLNLGNLTDRGTGVYGWHLHLSNSSVIDWTRTTVSSYVAVVVQGPPHVIVTPSDAVIHHFDERLDVACSVDSAQSMSAVLWFENNTPVYGRNNSDAGGRIKSYLTVRDRFDGIEVKHYTCSATNGVGITTNATVYVVEGADAGGWSWWMESSQCSTTCGIDRGIRLRRRRCFRTTSRCPGSNIAIATCFPPISHCPIQTQVTPTPPTTITQTPQVVITSQNTGTEIISVSVHYNETENATANLRPTVLSNVKNNDRGKPAEKSCASSSSQAVIIASATSAIGTGIVSAVFAAALTYCLMRRKNRKQMNTALESLSRPNVSSTSGEDSLRYAPGAAVARKLPNEASAASPTVQTGTRHMTSSSADQDQYESVQFVNRPSVYTPVTHLGSNRAEDAVYESAEVTVIPDISVTQRKARQISSSYYLSLRSQGKNEGVTNNTPETSGVHESEVIYANL